MRFAGKADRANPAPRGRRGTNFWGEEKAGNNSRKYASIFAPAGSLELLFQRRK